MPSGQNCRIYYIAEDSKNANARTEWAVQVHTVPVAKV